MAQRYQVDSVVRVEISGAAGVGMGWCYGCEYSKASRGSKIKISPYPSGLTGEESEMEKGPFNWRRILTLVSYSDHWTEGIDQDYLEESEKSFWIDRPTVQGVHEDLVPLFAAVACQIDGYRDLTQFITRCTDTRVQLILAQCPRQLWGPYEHMGDQERISLLVEVSSLYSKIFAMVYGMGGGSFRLFPRLRQLAPEDLPLSELLLRGKRIEVELEQTYGYLRSCYDKLVGQGPVSQGDAHDLVMHNRKTLKDMFWHLRGELGIQPRTHRTNQNPKSSAIPLGLPHGTPLHKEIQ